MSVLPAIALSGFFQKNWKWLLILVLVLTIVISIYLFGKSSSKKIKLPAVGRDRDEDHLSAQEAVNVVSSLENYLNSGWITTYNEFVSAYDLLIHLDKEDLRLVYDAYLNLPNKGYDNLRALFNAQNYFYSDSKDKYDQLMSKFSTAGI